MAALVLPGCGDPSEAPPRASFTVHDSAGVEIVVAHAPLLDSASPLRLSPSPVVRIGAVTGELPYLFSSISGLTRLSDGRIAVLDEMSRELRFFAPDGRHLSTSGRSGVGPGEFQSPGGLERQVGDTLQVEDHLTRIRWAADGTFVEQLRTDWTRVRQLGDFYLECGGALPHFIGHDVIGCSGAERVSDAEGAEASLRGSTRVIVRILPSLDRVDTIARVFTSGLRVAWYRSRAVGLAPPYVPGGILATGGDPPRIAYASTETYSIQIRDLEGGLVRIIRRPGGNRSPREQDLMPWEMPGGRRDVTAFELDELPEIDSVSSLESLFVDEMNHTWGGLNDPLLDGGSWYDVFDDAGRYLAQIELPPHFTPFEIGYDYVLGVRKDALDVEFVEMYRLFR